MNVDEMKPDGMNALFSQLLRLHLTMMITHVLMNLMIDTGLQRFGLVPYFEICDYFLSLSGNKE